MVSASVGCCCCQWRMRLLWTASSRRCCGIEDTNKVVVGCVEGDVCWNMGEMGVETWPNLGNGEVSWLLGVEVLKNDVQGAAGDS